jgi:hypothetical protein
MFIISVYDKKLILNWLKYRRNQACSGIPLELQDLLRQTSGFACAHVLIRCASSPLVFLAAFEVEEVYFTCFLTI